MHEVDPVCLAGDSSTTIDYSDSNGIQLLTFARFKQNDQLDFFDRITYIAKNPSSIEAPVFPIEQNSISGNVVSSEGRVV